MQHIWTPDTLITRPFQMTDSDALVAGLNNLNVTRWLGTAPYPYRKHNAVDFLQSTPKSQAITLTGDDQVIGAIYCGDDLGYWLAEPYWGQGIMGHVVRRTVVQFFVEHPTAVLKSAYAVGNVASARIQATCGFRETGRALDPCAATGEPMLCVHTEATRGDWSAAHPQWGAA